MARSLRKGPFVSGKLVKKVRQMDESGRKTPIKTWSRASMIPPGCTPLYPGKFSKLLEDALIW